MKLLIMNYYANNENKSAREIAALIAASLMSD